MFSRRRKKYDGKQYKTTDTVMDGDGDHHNIYYKIIAITVKLQQLRDKTFSDYSPNSKTNSHTFKNS